MTSLERFRSRTPLVVFVLLVALALVLLGIACLCSTDHPSQAVERALAAFASLPAVIEVWSFAFATFALVPIVLEAKRERDLESSAARLQRFLF